MQESAARLSASELVWYVLSHSLISSILQLSGCCVAASQNQKSSKEAASDDSLIILLLCLADAGDTADADATEYDCTSPIATQFEYIRHPQNVIEQSTNFEL